MVAYHERLGLDPRWALEQGAKFFMGESDVNEALRRITTRLDSLGIPYAVVGGMALFLRGYRRFTEDVDLLVRSDDLQRIHELLEGRGYRPKFEGSRDLRDAEAGVAIEFLVAGEFPGDGKEKPIAFPDPAVAAEIVAGIKCIGLANLIELKLASGMTAPGRLRDLADVQELIKVLKLDASYADNLNPYVRERFESLIVAD